MNPVIRHEVVGQPASSNRIRIAHLSDFHLWLSDRKLRQLEPIMAEWKPDVLALTGDYADTSVGRRLTITWIQRMAAIYPVCWVAGNHDRWWGRSFLHKLEAIPRAYPIDRRDTWITGKSGCRFRFTGWERIAGHGTTGSAPEPTIVLLHNPAVIQPEQLRGGGKCLLLAGHLHGGQITLWRDSKGRPQPAASCYKWLVDRETIGDASLIVSRGLGDSLPFRFRAPKEIVFVDF